MADVTVHTFPGYQISLIRVAADSVPTSLAESREALGVLAELAPVARPLTAELTLGCFDSEGLEADPEGGPTTRQAYVRAREIAAHVADEPGMIPDRIDERADLNEEFLAVWIADALNQACPTPGYATRWTVLDLPVMAARLVGRPGAPAATLSLNTERGVVDVPTLERDGASWVAGPNRNPYFEGPFRVRFLSDMGRLTATVSVLWSLWTQPETPGFQLLRDAVTRLVDAGWELEGGRWLGIS
jgi:hypothetical protein